MYDDAERLRRHVDAMGDELGPVYDGLWKESVCLRRNWHECLKLFGEGKGRIEFLNDVASGFFGIAQLLYFEDVCLRIARLVDSPKVSGYSNLTIRSLPNLVCETFANKTCEKVEVAVKKAKLIKTWRNKAIAHLDLDIHERGSEQLKSPTREDVDRSLEAIEDALNSVAGLYGVPPTTFDHIPQPLVQHICSTSSPRVRKYGQVANMSLFVDTTAAVLYERASPLKPENCSCQRPERTNVESGCCPITQLVFDK